MRVCVCTYVFMVGVYVYIATCVHVYVHVCVQVNSGDGGGVMRECYTGSYTGGTAPCRWNGSTAILQRFHRSKQPVR